MKVHTIILNWNNLDDTIETIKSLVTQDYEKHSILLVDNNSNTYIREYLRRQFPDIVHLQNNENLGYTGGNNSGIIYSLQHDPDIIIIANNDIFLDKDNIITEIVDTFRNHKDISILGPKLMDYYDRSVVQEQGTTIFHSSSDIYHFNEYMKCTREISNNIKYFDGVPGAFMAVRKDVFLKIGLFDENLFMYGDETDFCYRGWVNNYCSAVNSNIVVYHKGDNSAQTNSPSVIYYKTRNLLYLIKKHKKSSKYYYYFLKKYYLYLIKILLNKILKKEPVSSQIRGMYDGIFNKMGKRK
jgi:hypothetical protein